LQGGFSIGMGLAGTVRLKLTPGGHKARPYKRGGDGSVVIEVGAGSSKRLSQQLLLEGEEILQELLAGLGQDGFGVELDAFQFVAAVADAHDDAVLGFGGDGEFAGERFSFDDQRVIAGGGERVGEFAEDAFGIVLDRAGLAVEKFGSADHFATESGADRLVTEADSEDWEFAGESADQVDADAGILRGAGAGRDYDALGFAASDFVYGNFVVAVDFYIAAEFAQVLGQVVGEGVVVVEEQDHFVTQPLRRCADSRAVSRARDLFTLS
jgi:hypothetical protein